MYIKKNKIIKLANIIEEPRIGGPQLRLLSIASALQGKIDVTIIFPINNSKNFETYCKEHSFTGGSVSLLWIEDFMKKLSANFGFNYFCVQIDLRIQL